MNDHDNVTRANAADRAARKLDWWKGHLLSPSTRKADRQITYDCILRDIVAAVLNDPSPDGERTLESILLAFKPVKS